MLTMNCYMLFMFIILPVSLQSSKNDRDRASDTSIEQTDDSGSSENEENLAIDRATKSEEIGNSIPLDAIPEYYLTSKEHWASSNENNKKKVNRKQKGDNSNENEPITMFSKTKRSKEIRKSTGTNEKEGVEDIKTKEVIETLKNNVDIKNKDYRESKPKYPYAVSVQKKGSHHATGALVTVRWVLTSAREFYHIREAIRLLRVRYGTVNCKRGPTMPVMSINIHPGFDRAPNYDVSLLKMAADIVPTNSVAPIALAQEGVVGDTFLTTYWARLIINNTILPRDAKERYKSHSLRVSKQNIIPQEKCQEDLREEGITLNNHSLCLKPIIDHHTDCLPDPGAPVMMNGFLHGVTSSWSPADCEHGPRVTVVVDVTQGLTRDWVEGTIL